jgi:hypothetical protein
MAARSSSQHQYLGIIASVERQVHYLIDFGFLIRKQVSSTIEYGTCRIIDNVAQPEPCSTVNDAVMGKKKTASFAPVEASIVYVSRSTTVAAVHMK